MIDVESFSALYPAIDRDLLLLVIHNAEEFIIDYCNLDSWEPSFDSILFLMVREDLNRLSMEGISSQSVGGNTIAVYNDYSPQVYKRLKKHKRIKVC